MNSISSHPLMLIARSGQQNLVKHEATSYLLHLKWRYLPRLVFTINLLTCLALLIGISVYSGLIMTSSCNNNSTILQPAPWVSNLTINCDNSTSQELYISSLTCAYELTIKSSFISCKNASVFYNLDSLSSECGTLNITCISSEFPRDSIPPDFYTVLATNCDKLRLDCTLSDTHDILLRSAIEKVIFISAVILMITKISTR